VEFLMNALRLPDGVESAWLPQRTGVSLADIALPLAEARKRGWIEPASPALRATSAGLERLNSVLALFL
jgi:coproporphyrinogen III oxidase-like Fe-S oxidoreductase